MTQGQVPMIPDEVVFILLFLFIIYQIFSTFLCWQQIVAGLGLGLHCLESAKFQLVTICNGFISFFHMKFQSVKICHGFISFLLCYILLFSGLAMNSGCKYTNYFRINKENGEEIHPCHIIIFGMKFVIRCGWFVHDTHLPAGM